MKGFEPIDSALNAHEIHALSAAAREASGMAHAPYSRFEVGAALLDDAGHIHRGCNVENASYGLTMCAERVAVGAAVSAGARGIRAVAIYTPTTDLTPPCGACRQVLAEFGNESMEIHLFNAKGEHAVTSLGQLLPAAFGFEGPLTR